MKPVRVLLFIDWYRPGFKAGGPVQSCANLVTQLQGNDISFHIITRITDYCETEAYPGITPNTWTRRHDGSEVIYLSEDQLNRETFTKIISATDFDIAYINGIYSRWFSIEPLRLCKKLKTDAHIVVATRGMLAPSAMAIKAFKKKLFLRMAKLTRLYKNIVFHSTGAHETAHIKAVLGNVEVAEAANLSARNSVVSQQKTKSPGSLKLICVARIAPEKNIDYALQILAGVKSIIEFDLYGPVYSEAYSEVCRKIAAALPANITVRFNTPVAPDELPAKFAQAHVLFLPTRGENFGHVILEALTAGCPALISDRTPWRNLEAQKAGFDISLDEQQDMIDAIEKFAGMDTAAFDLWSQNAQQLASAHLNNSADIAANRKLFGL
jgi:glycosyltransferase involved in cell wall biosynthesis